jgi:hypothetical protein
MTRLPGPKDPVLPTLIHTPKPSVSKSIFFQEAPRKPWNEIGSRKKNLLENFWLQQTDYWKKAVFSNSTLFFAGL